MSCKSQQKEMKYEVIKTDNEWREQLDQMSYLVLRKAYTERPYTGKYDNFYEKGTYHCAGSVSYTHLTLPTKRIV